MFKKEIKKTIVDVQLYIGLAEVELTKTAQKPWKVSVHFSTTWNSMERDDNEAHLMKVVAVDVHQGGHYYSYMKWNNSPNSSQEVAFTKRRSDGGSEKKRISILIRQVIMGGNVSSVDID